MTETFTLGGRNFELRPLKLGQLRGLLDALDEMTGKSGGALIDAAARVVSAGLGADQLSADALLDLEATVGDLNAAVAAVLRVAGLTPVGETTPVATSEDSSAPSTALSPPAADTITGQSTN